MKKILYIILLLSMSYSQTNVSGTVSGSWTLDGSPYDVVGDVDIITTLDIEPGVFVTFQGNYSINVYGQLTANGTEENPIVIIDPNSIAENSQIKFNNSWNGCSLTYVVFGGPRQTAGKKT